VKEVGQSCRRGGASRKINMEEEKSSAEEIDNIEK